MLLAFECPPRPGEWNNQIMIGIMELPLVGHKYELESVWDFCVSLVLNN